MVEGRQRNEWNHTSQILAMIYNAHRSPKSRMMKPAEFHPFTAFRKTMVSKVKDIGILKEVFLKDSQKNA